MQPCLYERYNCAICHNMMYLKTKETPNPKCEECDSINVEPDLGRPIIKTGSLFFVSEDISS